MTGLDGVRTTETPAESCRACGVLQEAASDVTGSGQVPGPDDITICLYCGELSRFDAEMKRQPVDALEQAAMEPWLQDQIEAARAAIRQMSGGST